MRVFVYFNSRSKLWSIRALEGPDKHRVVARANSVALKNVTPRVSEAGRQRVLREGRKNVHAGLVGEWGQLWDIDPGITARLVTYNPYKYESFVYRDDETPYEGSDVAVLTNKHVYVA